MTNQEYKVNQNDKGAHLANVGKRVRELRLERRMSIRDVSRHSGISANALSMIERGLTSPSVSTLYQLVEALGVPITVIFQVEPLLGEIVFRPAAERTRVPFPLGIWEGLGGEAFVGRVQPFMLTLETGADSGLQPIVHTGHEFVMCLQGQLEYRVEEEIFQLAPGDSLLFAARLHHFWRNPGNSLTQAVFVLSGFDEYEKPADFHKFSSEG
jgi:transcriptional regulator with XRE-family HTH domain